MRINTFLEPPKPSIVMTLFIVTFALSATTGEIDLRTYEKRLISQHGEDGVIGKIFELIGVTNKYFVEFGAGDGHFCSNTKYLREKHGWTGLLLEGAYPSNPPTNQHKEFITAENICNLFSKYHVPKEFDLISIDIDRNDFYVWNSLSAHYKPRLVIIEFSKSFNFDEDKVIEYSADKMWNGGEYTGASMLALAHLGQKLGYSLIYQESEGTNLFFIRDDILESGNIKFKNTNNVSKIYNATPGFSRPNTTNELFVSSQEALLQYYQTRG